MELVRSLLWISVVTACVGFCTAKDKEQVTTTVQMINVLDAAICKLDQSAVTAALKKLEQAGVQVRSLPFLKKLQNVDGAKRRGAKITAWAGGVAAGCAGFVAVDTQCSEIFHWFFRHMR